MQPKSKSTVKQTPLEKQYHDIKIKYPDAILLFRMGDFFETFEEDAKITSKVCGITLTKRNSGLNDKALAGFPHTQLEVYLPKIVKAGYKVAVCEQLEDPKLAKGIVKRGIVEVVTPGMAMYDRLLSAKSNNYLACVSMGTGKRKKPIIGFAAADISTGEFVVSEFAEAELPNVLETFHPSEILINRAQKSEILTKLRLPDYSPAINQKDEWFFSEEFAKEAVIAHFKVKNLKGLGLETYTAALEAAGAMLQYIKETQVADLEYIQSINYYNANDYMNLDFATRRNLEITFEAAGNSEEKTQGGTLLSVLDMTETPMGSRLMKKWITQPLLDSEKINSRLDAVEVLFNQDEKREDLRNCFENTGDLERLVSKISSGRANPRDMVSLDAGLKTIPVIKHILKSTDSGIFAAIADKFSDFSVITELLDSAFLDEPTVQLGTAAVFREGYNSQLDEYVNARRHSKEWLNEYLLREREATGISNLKVGYTSVFGYYLEVSRGNRDKAPERYERKQTLTNAERYTTEELKEFENKILTAEDQIAAIEQSLFTEIKVKIAVLAPLILKNADLIARADCIASFAEVSKRNGYTKPEIDDSETIEILAGRHPVVEQMLPVGEKFIPNDTHFDYTENGFIHLITGPNMAGKSCYLRQVGIIVLLGQIGCFVPAEKAKYGVVDRIFTRVGASDNLRSGESTFLVEMQEVANILRNATHYSLALLDEIGRGTATEDGLAIAYAAVKYIHSKLKTKTLFATHFHELNRIAESMSGVRNFRAEVIERDSEEEGDKGKNIIFTHKITAGNADRSYGIYVAQLAGVPAPVIKDAYRILESIKFSENSKRLNSSSKEVSNANQGTLF